MTHINLHEAKARFAYYTRRVKAGETIVLCDRNQPFAEIRPFKGDKTVSKTPRTIGTMQDWLTYYPDTFNEPLSDLEVAINEDIFPSEKTSQTS